MAPVQPSRAPLAGYAALGPAGRAGSPATGRPEDGIIGIVLIGPGLIRNLLEIGEVRREAPLVRVTGGGAIPAKKYLAAGFAVQKFKHM